MGATRGRGFIEGRQPFPVFGDDTSALGIGGEVRPFIGIPFEVVEFLAAIGVTDIAPALAADTMVSLVMTGDSRAVARGSRVPELRPETDSFQIGSRSQPA